MYDFATPPPHLVDTPIAFLVRPFGTGINVSREAKPKTGPVVFAGRTTIATAV